MWNLCRTYINNELKNFFGVELPEPGPDDLIVADDTDSADTVINIEAPDSDGLGDLISDN